MKEKTAIKQGFTLIELLVVIAIIGILAAMLFAVLPAVTVTGKKTKAKVEAQAIATAIEQYDSTYGRFPISPALQSTLQSVAWTNDFTYGGSVLSNVTGISSYYWTNNSEVIAILMNITNYPNGSGPTANNGYMKNPQQTIFLTAKMSGWNGTGTPQPGVGNDLVYRDPWGNPYIISMDFNYDEQCRDAFYCLTAVSGLGGANINPGLNGLVTPNTARPNNFLYHGRVMVWSAGPPIRGQVSIDPTAPANSSANKGHILSWQ
jgi:prepilin-type N-terminal cleavage/methylation domain-containing protein